MEKGQNTQKDEIMEEFYKTMRKQVFYSRIAAIAGAVIALTIVISCAIVVPKVCGTLKQADALLVDASDALTNANDAIDSVKTMSDGIAEVGEKLDTFVEDNSKSLETVVANMESIDFEGLNNAITDLSNVVEPLAKFFNVFHK